MPVMDGWEMLYEIRQNAQTQNTPVIALTAHALSGIKMQTKQAGFVDHIAKPLDPHKFIEQVIGIIEDVPELAAILATTAA